MWELGGEATLPSSETESADALQILILDILSRQVLFPVIEGRFHFVLIISSFKPYLFILRERA